MLPEPIDKELFSPFYRVNDMAVDYICDALLAKGFVICEVFDYDSSIIIEFIKPASQPNIRNLRIDRINGVFELLTEDKVEHKGDFDSVLRKLDAIIAEEGPSAKLSQAAKVIRSLIDQRPMRLSEVVNMIRGRSEAPFDVSTDAVRNFLYELESRGFGTLGPGSDPMYTPK